MSILDHLPTKRIYWYAGGGSASGEFGRTKLTTKPYLGFTYCEIDYSPPVVSQVRREPWHAADDMTTRERDACEAYLRSLRPVDTTTGLVDGGPVYGHGA